MAVLMKTYCAFGFTRKGQAGGFPAALPPPIRTLRCTEGTQSANWHASCGVVSAVREILMYTMYIPVSVLRAPCTPTARYGFLSPRNPEDANHSHH